MEHRLFIVGLSTIIFLSACSLPAEFPSPGFQDSQYSLPEVDFPVLDDTLLTALDSGAIDAIVSSTELSAITEQLAIATLNDAVWERHALLSDSAINSISWDPTHDAALLSATVGENFTVLATNDSNSSSGSNITSHALSIGGYHGDTPYLVLGSNPLRNLANANDDMLAFMRNAVN